MDTFLEVLIFLPTFGAIIGYVCKWVAIRMLFAPSEFVGVGPIGWQGVVQRQAPKFANGVADTVERAGIRVEALLDKVDGDKVIETFGPALDAEAMGLLETVVETAKPGAWAEFAPAARDQMAEQLSNEGRRVGKVVLDELKPEIARAVDVRTLVVKQLSGENADTLAVLFQRIARNELRIVILYGAVLGFLIGLLEVGVWEVIEKWWLLPLVGAIDGLVNNWLAIQMIFRCTGVASPWRRSTTPSSPRSWRISRRAAAQGCARRSTGKHGCRRSSSSPIFVVSASSHRRAPRRSRRERRCSQASSASGCSDTVV